jgi:membrane associated rhomboid family serine protease
MIIPYSTEVLITKWPFSNLAIMGGCIVSFIVLLANGFSAPVLDAMILTGWNPVGLIGHQFIHAGFMHLLFNMLYLWVFGNAVCEKIGNLAFAGTFLLAGVAAGGIHIILDGDPAVGASGAINGIVGLYLVLYPINRINCFFWFFRPGTFDISGYWIIIFWFIVDAWNAFTGADNGIAYWAHVGGFLSGFGMGILFLKTGVARMARYDNPTLLDYMSRRHPQDGFKTAAKGAMRAPARPELAGSRASRPAPQTAPVPNLAAQDLNLDCPHCSQNLDVPVSVIGQAFACPACGGAIELEGA